METLTRAEKIKVKRLKQGMSREQLAYKVGVTQGTIYNIENGKGCNVETLIAIATALDCNIQEIV